jgi:hypothetical protein
VIGRSRTRGAGGMEYRIRDGRAGPGNPNFPDAARAKRIQLGVGNVDAATSISPISALTGT